MYNLPVIIFSDGFEAQLYKKTAFELKPSVPLDKKPSCWHIIKTSIHYIFSPLITFNHQSNAMQIPLLLASAPSLALAFLVFKKYVIQFFQKIKAQPPYVVRDILERRKEESE